MWKPEPAVPVLAWRILKKRFNQVWAQDLLYLESGDTVTLIKDLDVKGAGFTATRATLMKNISLILEQSNLATQPTQESCMYKLVFFVPESHLTEVKAAVFATGAGKIGDYEQCCFETRGTGQFKPLAGATPFIGQAGQLEQVAEVRVELVCDDGLIHDAIAALRAAHPYEEPAFDVWPLSEF